MNELFLATNWLTTTFQQDPLIHTVAFESIANMDMNKQNIYPLANIDIIDSIITDGLITFNYQITILQQRDVDNQQNGDKIFGSNLIDNLSETHGIATRFINSLTRSYNADGIFIGEISNILMLKEFSANGLDGVQFNIGLESQNNTSTC